MTEKSNVQEGQCDDRMAKVWSKINGISVRLWMILGGLIVIGALLPFAWSGIKGMLDLRFKVLETQMEMLIDRVGDMNASQDKDNLDARGATRATPDRVALLDDLCKNEEE